MTAIILGLSVIITPVNNLLSIVCRRNSLGKKWKLYRKCSDTRVNSRQVNLAISGCDERGESMIHAADSYVVGIGLVQHTVIKRLTNDDDVTSSMHRMDSRFESLCWPQFEMVRGRFWGGVFNSKLILKLPYEFSSWNPAVVKILVLVLFSVYCADKYCAELASEKCKTPISQRNGIKFENTK